jgi:phage tail-like protein
MAEITPKAYYALYDFHKKELGNYDSLTGGEMTVSSIAYKAVSEKGYAVTKYLPGLTTYTPVTLLRAFDSGANEMYKKFEMISNLNLKVRSNFSVVMIDQQGKAQAMWNLINAMPTKISGFSFNSHTESSYTDFEITLQPEYIELMFY